MESDEEIRNPFRYGTQIWQLFNEAPRAGEFPAGEPGVAGGQAGTPAARSVLQVQLKFAQGRVVDARFRAYGCPTSIAVGAWLAEWAQGKNASELGALSMRQLRHELEIPDDRAHCALLGEDALKAALVRYVQESAS